MKFNYNGILVEAFRYKVDPTPEWFVKCKSNIKTIMDDDIFTTSKGDRVIHKGDYIIYKPIADLYYATTADKFEKISYPVYDKSIENDKKYYWNDKIRVAEKAISHTKRWEKEFKKDNEQSVRDSVIYRSIEDMSIVETSNYDTQYHLYLQGTTDSVYLFLKNQHWANVGRIAILNYASFKEPGGGFLSGSRAQEESLCHRSNLYNVLSKFTNSYYKDNHKELNYGLYTHATLYTPDIIFKLNDDNSFKRCDVITTAAPNLSAIKRNQNMFGKGCHITTRMINDVLKERIDFILYIAYLNKVENIVLGPFGCGVFGNDPNIVANEMKMLLETKYRGVFKNVIFSLPIISKDTSNTLAFWNTFKK